MTNLVKTTRTTKFFDYNQNNSGGHFKTNDRVAQYVIIEAPDADTANYIAESIGLYFDGEGDCPCCGNRWSPAWDDDDATEVPTIYGIPVDEYLEKNNSMFAKSGDVVCHVYYANGLVDTVYQK